MSLLSILKKILSALKTLYENVPEITSTYAKVGSLLICYGTGVITPSAANTATQKTVSFSKTYAIEPVVVISLGAAPQANMNLAVYSIAKSSFVAHIYSANTTGRRYYYIAVGEAA